ncbi:hypothetical protein SISSUDRAFT_199648 [Sistotremastrum suecicum HHB10207 ss-3]|uniref:DUF6535 domain-containing protein n=1 Tax=Sistotremastrum suecicum HHB10207 ss-3 TaxID=1314776 RepID=A0A166AAG7_9AGAM|nr:hypothetical protein SISSUDRAFT_199648 [Sistotremastrum suecicum HHB10207 ss-3]
MVSVFNSVLCVLGMQWAARLIATPLGNTNLERTLARERRAAVAEGYMLSLMGILVWTLLLSIGFFVLGFLIQLWEIAVSFTGRAPILLFGGAFATGLSVIIMGIIVVTTFHAALHNNSPFESPLSNLLQPFLRWSRYILPQEFGSDEKDNNDVDLEKKGQNDNEDQGEYPDEWEGGQNTPETDAVEDVEALVRWQKSDPEDVQALKAYARLVINATDMEVLERAVPSFEFGEWHKAGMSLSPIFMAVRDRFLATDTSFRLKETVNQQLVYFKDWKGWCNQYGSWRDDIRADDFTRWCKAQCKGLIEESRGSRRDLFPAFAFFTSLEDANRDLRGYQSTAETDDACIARILTTYNSTGEIGLRGDLFETAVIACDTLLQDGKVDEVTAILSDVEHYYVIQSFIRNPSTWWFRVSDLVSFMTKGKEVEILEEMCTFFSELPEMTVISGDDSDPLLICQFLEQLSKDLPKDFIAPLSFDLSPVIAILDKEKLFKRYANTLIYYLTRGAMEGLSDHHLTSGFWQHCRDVCLDETRSDDDLDSYLRNDSYFRADRDAKRAQVAGFYQDYHGCFIPLPLVGLSDEECDDLCNNICTSIRTAHDLTERQADDEINDDQERTYLVKDCKRPILELLDLEQDQRANVLTRILSNIQRSELLRFLLQDTRLDWERIKDLVSDITSGHEIGLLADISTSRHFRYFGTHANVRVFLSLLAHFIPLLPSDFTVSPDFDITRVLFTMNGTQFRLYQRERQHWSKDVATIIFYLDHGAFDAISDRYLFMAGEFFKLCQTDSPRMVDWTDDERISEDVQSRVAFYEKAFETRNAGMSLFVTTSVLA